MKNGLQSLRDWIYLLGGWAIFFSTRKTPSYSYQSLIRLFCRSRGASNDRMSSWISFFNRRFINFNGQCGILGSIDADTLASHTAVLREHGYLLFPSVLPKEVCDRLVSFALETPAVVRPMDGQSVSINQLIRYDPLNPAAVRYDLPVQQLLDNEDIQGLLADPSLLAIAQSYFNCLPRVDMLGMWWHSNFHACPDSEAAQLYHFDMDRVRWLKIFIYLTDVGPNDGPHHFVSGSHQTGAIPEKILNKGYNRLSDDEVIQSFGEKKLVEFCAPKGSIIVEDTRGLHKGDVVKANGRSRLMLQLQLSNSLFGGTAPSARLNKISHPELAKRVQSDSLIFEQFMPRSMPTVTK